DQVETIAQRAAEIAIDCITTSRSSSVPSPYLTVNEAAAYLRCKPQRIYNLTSAGRLTRLKDGSRVLIARQELDRCLHGETGGSIGQLRSALQRPGRRT